MMWIVYITCEFDSCRYYIGKTSAAKLAAGYTGSGLWAFNARRKGRKLVAEAVFSTDNETDAYDAEVFFVQGHKGDPLCMNISDGGEGCNWELAGAGIRAFWADPLKAAAAHAKRSDSIRTWHASRSDRSLSAKTKTKTKMSEARRGRRHTKETLAKMSVAQTGRTFSDETRAKMKASAQARWRRENG